MEEEDALKAELVEIDENLIRAELTPAQRAVAVARRKDVWEALHPNTGQSSPTISDRGRGRPKEFAAETETATGEPKRTVNQNLARAEGLGPDIHAVTHTLTLAHIHKVTYTHLTA